MHIEVTYARPPEYFASLIRPAAQRAIRRRLVVSGSLLLLILLASALIGGQTGLIFAAAGIAVTAVGMVLLRRRYTAALAVPASCLAPREYVITDDALESRTEVTSSRWSWDAVRSFSVTDDAVVFRQDGGVAFDVPRAAMTVDQEAELLTSARTRGLGSGAGSGPAAGRRRH